MSEIGGAIAPIEQSSIESASSPFAGITAFEDGQRMAKALAACGMVPDAYRNNLGNCLMALELSNRLHMSPLAVMQNLHIVKGKPRWSAEMDAAVINLSPHFGRLRYQWSEAAPGEPNYGCRAYTEYAETGEIVYGAWVTWSMVKAEGWSNSSSSKWNSMPEQMFMYRAATFFRRAYAPDLLTGLGFGEPEDISANGTRRVSRLNQVLQGEVVE